jgi:hypothetical protein
MSNINDAYKEGFLFNGLNIKDHDINNANKKILDRNISVFGNSPCYQQKNVNIDSILKNISKKCNNYRPNNLKSNKKSN